MKKATRVKVMMQVIARSRSQVQRRIQKMKATRMSNKRPQVRTELKKIRLNRSKQIKSIKDKTIRGGKKKATPSNHTKRRNRRV